jgi:hypothetical protein
MTNEERFIEENFGKKNPYRVPEGYFDHFTEQLLSQLPEQQAAEPVRHSRLKVLRPILMAAACLCIAIFSVTIYLNRSQDAPESAPVATTQSTNSTINEEEDYMDAAADYVMLDNADIYACLSE